jgi:D-alanine-D-alanine ligase-like ATP-grasp enzyme
MHVVLLGPRPEVIEELHGLGHTLTALYAEFSRHNAEKYADRLAHRGFIPAYDAPELAWSVLLHLGVTEEVDVVIPCNELAVVTASLLNGLLGRTDRIGLRTAMAGRDKAFQKSLWARHGVPTARYATLTNTPRDRRELADALAALTGPFVVKPPSLGGSRLVRSCPTVDDVFAALKDDGEMRHAVVEERQEGDEWHFDGVVDDGHVRHVMVSRYLAPLIETKHGKTLRSVAYPVEGHADLYAEAREFAQSASDALGGRCGVFHLEVFGKPGGFTAGELAWRPAGVLAPLSAERTIGLNLWAAHARVLIGEELPPPAPVDGRVVGFVCLPLRTGARNGVTREDVEALPGVCHVQMLVKPGEVMGEMFASTRGVAMVLVEGPDVDGCARLIDEAVALTNALHERKSA